MNPAIYVPLASVATACGLSEYRLMTHHWPAHWGVPREWRMIPRSSTVLVSEAALPELARNLAEAGETEAGRRVLAWLEEITTPGSGVAEPWYLKGQYA